jgi:hypothetical protein
MCGHPRIWDLLANVITSTRKNISRIKMDHERPSKIFAR